MKRILWIAVIIIVIILIFVVGQRGESPESQTESSGLDPGIAPAETAQLTAIDPFSGDGRATREFGDKEFFHAVRANIGDPAPGKFYEGWLVDKTPTLRFFSTGKLERQGNQYVLSYSANISERNFSEYNDVVITQETEADGLDGVPEDHVLEGSF